MEAEFTIPESGKSSILLMKDPNNYMINVVPKWDKKILVISTKIEGEFGNQITLDNFDYICDRLYENVHSSHLVVIRETPV